MPFCTSCGYRNIAVARFCLSCGQPMPMATPQPVPTSTPAPTILKRGSSFFLVLLGIIVILAIIYIAYIATTDDTASKSIENYTCNDLVDMVIDLSKEGNTVEILKIYTPKEIRDSSRKLECKATAQTREGKKDIKFYLEQDADGDWFYGLENYRFR